MLLLPFFLPLLQALRLSFKEDLFSHLLLVPFITGYLIWIRRGDLSADSGPAGGAVVGLAVAGALLGVGYIGSVLGLLKVASQTGLALAMSSFVLLVAAGFGWCFGAANLKKHAFALCFLVFMIPWPQGLVDGVETFFQVTSAEAANALLSVSGLSYVRDGLQFKFPSITLVVAQECSGIRSSLVLFMTSLLAGHMFLTTTWKKVFLAFFVIPLGIVRNGFRIATLAMLCEHVSPDMIHSWIHHKGGPFFFLLSLVPFFAVLLWLRKTERKVTTNHTNDTNGSLPQNTRSTQKAGS